MEEKSIQIRCHKQFQTQQESEEGRKELESTKAMVKLLEEKKKSTGGKGKHILAEDYMIDELRYSRSFHHKHLVQQKKENPTMIRPEVNKEN